ncbi:MAG: hypothetical protein J2P37_29860 [Ktedonobacteraceae bacterium]|nr:hypothetical protein [Ktedonobacteraceae bacterium]
MPLLTGIISHKNGTPVFDVFQQIMLGFAVYTVMAVTRLSWSTAALVSIERRLESSRNLRRSIDRKLEEIRESYFAILERVDYDKNFPAQYFDRMISSLQDRLYNAATKEEVRVDELSFACTEIICTVVANRKNQTLRLVYPLSNKDFVFDTWSRGYYRTLVQLAATKQVAEVRRLFIYDSPEDLRQVNFKRLFDFHMRAPRFDCRLVSRADWVKLQRDLRIHEGADDFGVWGDLIVYRAVAAQPDHIEGIYSAQLRTVEQYKEFFDLGWRHGKTPDPCPDTVPMSLFELFEGTPPPAHLAPGEAAVWKQTSRFSRSRLDAVYSTPDLKTGETGNG